MSSATGELQMHRMGQLQGLQSDGAVVGQTLSSDHPPPATFPSSGWLSRMMVSLERESFFGSFFFIGCFPSQVNDHLRKTTMVSIDDRSK
jgi:hypothetical protein